MIFQIWTCDLSMVKPTTTTALLLIQNQMIKKVDWKRRVAYHIFLICKILSVWDFKL